MVKRRPFRFGFCNKADPKEKRILESLEKRLSLLDTDRFPNSCSIEQINKLLQTDKEELRSITII